MSSRGTKAVAGLSSMGLVIGTLIPGTLLVVLGMVFLGQGNQSAAPMNAAHLFPQWTGLASLVLIVNNFLSYSGMEMNAVHVSSLRDPAKEFPRAMFTASGMVLAIFILPALAISWVVPSAELSLTAGVMQAFDSFFQYFHIGWLTPVIAVALVSASLGGMLTWLAGPSKGLLLISRQEGYLPPFLQRLNKEGVQQNLLVTQGVVTTVIALAYALIPNVSSAYWVFSVITTQVYLIVYLLMFAAAIRLRRTQPDHPRGYHAPAAGPDRRHRPGGLGGGDGDRLRAVLAVRQRLGLVVRADRRRRPGGPGSADPVPVPAAAQAGVALARGAGRARRPGGRRTRRSRGGRAPQRRRCGMTGQMASPNDGGAA